MRAPFIVLCALAFCVGQAAAHSGNVSPGPLRPESLAGRPMKPNHPTGAGPHGFPECTLIGDNAWNFNSLDFVVDTEYEYLNQGEPSQGWMATYPMHCGYNPSGPNFFPVCPEHFNSGGPGDTGYANINSYYQGPYRSVGLYTKWNSWTQNYRSPNSATFSYHIRTDSAIPASRIGWLGPPVLKKYNEFFIGADAGGTHGERNCWNIAGIADEWGTQGEPLSGQCGASVAGGNDGLGETTGVGSIPQSEWKHFVFVWDSNFSQWQNGTIRIYVDGAEVYNSGPNIVGQWAYGTSEIGIGVPPSYYSNTRYHIDNLQMFDRAVTAAEAKRLNCDVPD